MSALSAPMTVQVLCWLAIAGVAIAGVWWHRSAQRALEKDEALARRISS